MPHRECSRNIYWRFFYLSSKATYWRGRNRTCLLSRYMLVASQMLHANWKDFYTMPFLRLSFQQHKNGLYLWIPSLLINLCTVFATGSRDLPQTQYRWQGFAPCMIRFNRWAKALHTNLYVVPMSNLTYERLPVPPQRYLKTQKSTDLGFSSCFLCLQCYSVTYPKRLNYQALPNSFSLLFLYDLALLANNFHLNIQHLHKSPIFIICNL